MPVRTRPSWTIRCGFTLIELVLVIAIMLVIAAIAAPRYSAAVERYRLETAARRVAADISLARAIAMASGASQTISFDCAAGTYVVSGTNSFERPNRSYVVSLGQEPFRAGIQSADFGGSSTLTINGYGLPAAGGRVDLNGASGAKSVLVDGTTGLVSFP